MISNLNGTDLSEKLNKNRDALKLSKVEYHLHPLIVLREHEQFWQWHRRTKPPRSPPSPPATELLHQALCVSETTALTTVGS